MKRARFVLVLLALSLVVLFLFRRSSSRGMRDSGPSASSSSELTASSREGVPAPRRFASASVPHSPNGETFGRANPVIRSVHVDKAEVCRGEENFVDVDVYDPGGNDADLRITLSGTGFMGMGSTGIRMPFRLVAPLRAEEMPIVIVSGFGGTQAEQRIPFVKVNECASHSIVEIKLHKLPEVGPFAFELEAIAVPQDPLSEVSWDFGDGQHAVSQGSNIKHNYGNRPQHSRFSDFLISVSGRRSSGDLVEGSRTFELFNRDYWDRRVARQ